MKEINVKKAIKAFNERLRVARNAYGENSVIVKTMINRAQMLDLEWTEKGISAKKSNLEKIKTRSDDYRFDKYIKKNSAATFIDKTTTPEQKKEYNKYKGQNRYDKINELITDIMVSKEIAAKIWTEMYDAGYDEDDCNQVYDAIVEGKCVEALNQYRNGEITLEEFVDKVLKATGPDYSEYEEFDPDI